MSDARPIVAGALLLEYLSVLKRRGMLSDVREQVTKETRNLIDRPPLSFAWVETAIMEEIMVVIGKMKGRDVVKEIALEAARAQAGPIVFPFMRTLLTLGGATPESVFKHIHRVVALQSRGMTMSYSPGTPTSGTVELSYPYPTNDFVCASWEGVFRMVFEVCKTDGTVDPAELYELGHRARIRVRWGPDR